MRREPLRGDRVVLRLLEREHLPRCVNWFNDPEVTRFLARETPLTMEQEERWYKDYRAKIDEEIYAIEVEGRHIGNIGLHSIDRTNRKANVGIVIGEKEYWSKGFGADAMTTALRYAFGALGLHKVNLDVIEYNARALHLYEKCGFVQEGVRRDEILKRERYVNLIRMSILEEEFARAERERLVSPAARRQAGTGPSRPR